MPRARQKPNIKLAEALRAAREIATDGIVKPGLIDRKHRSILTKAGCLTQVIRGWYLLSSLDASGESSTWYGGYWAFLKHYLMARFGSDGYWLSAESSIDVLAGTTAIPDQISIFTKKASNSVLNLPHGTSVLFMSGSNNIPDELVQVNEVNVLPMDYALCMLSPSYFRNYPGNVEIILRQASLPASQLSAILIEHGFIASAQRIIGAYRAIGESSKAENMKADLEAVGYQISNVNPFEQ